MKIAQYSIYDAIMEIYNTPFVAFNDADAMRIVQAAATPQTQLYQHNQDFALYQVATYDNEYAVFENCTPPRLIARVSSLLKQLQRSQIENGIQDESDLANAHGIQQL